MSTTPLDFPSTFASSRRILVDLWLRHRNQRTLWLGGLLAAVCLALALVPLAFARHGDGAWAGSLMVPILGGMCGAMLLIASWLMTVANVMAQNHPVLARTVPGHARRLRAALLLLAGGVLVAVAFAAAGALAAAPVPLATAGAVPVMAAVCGAAVTLAYVGLAARWPALWIAMWVGPALLASDGTTLLPELAPLLAVLASPWAMAVFTAVVLAACAALVRGLVEEGGPRHEARHAALRRRSCRARPATAKGLEQFLPDGQQRRLSRLRDGLYGRDLERRLARGDSSPVARAMLAFGPAAHWTAQLGAAAGVALLVVVLAVVLLVEPANLAIGGVVTGFSVSLVFACSRTALNARGTLHATRGEQALVMLAPGVPRGGALNRAVGLRLASQFLVAWAFGLVVMQAVQALARTTVAFGALGALGTWRDVVLLLALCQLLLVPTLWRRWCRTAAPTPASIFVPVLLPGVVGLAATALVHAGVLSLAAASAGVVAGAAAWAGWRWIRIGAEPSMLPVGRQHR
ncbi:MAG: hypothetical protein ACTHL8_23555 [Burkholderiaceae bacterium]